MKTRKYDIRALVLVYVFLIQPEGNTAIHTACCAVSCYYQHDATPAHASTTLYGMRCSQMHIEAIA